MIGIVLLPRIPNFLSKVLFRSFETQTSFVNQVAQLREFAPGHPIVFALFHAGFIEYLAMKLFLRTRFNEDFELNEALGTSNFLLDYFSGNLRRIASAFGLVRQRKSRAALCSEELSKGNPIFMNFRLRDGSSALETPDSEKILALLRDKHPKLLLVPVVFVWRRAGRMKEEPPKDLHTWFLRVLAAPLAMPWYFLLGNPYRPRGLRKLVLMIRGYTKSMLRLADVIECKGKSPKSLRRQAYFSIQQEKRILLGPVYKSTSFLQEQILRNPSFKTFVSNLALEQGIHEKTLLERSIRLFQEMAVQYSYFITEIAGWVLERVFNSIYKGVTYEKEQFEALREDLREGSILLIPNHRSYFDFLLLSYILYKEQIMTPHVAAGINLNFWPVGHILKRGGAVFIRRQFRGDKLYTEILRRYIVQLLNHKYPFEFFIEGTRSRSGKLAPPKYGMLKMIFESFLNAELHSDLRIVPVSITYDKVTEENAHKRELEGGAKSKENVANLIKSGNVFFKSFGHVHLRFAPSINTKDWVRDTLKAEDLAEVDNRFGVQKLAFEICHRINESIPLTANGLVCFAFMTKPGNALTEKELFFWLDILRRDCNSLKHTLTPELQKNFTGATRAALERLLQEKVLETYEAQDDIHAYRVPAKQRIRALYYKNNVVHAFVNAGLAGLCKGRKENLFRLRNLLEFEFFFPEKEKQWERVQQIDPSVASDFYAHTLDDTLENIETGLSALKANQSLTLSEKDWVPRIMKFGQQKISEGAILRHEAINTQGFRSFLSLAKNEKWLSETLELNDKKLRVSDIERIEQSMKRLQEFRSSLCDWNTISKYHH